MLLPQEKIAKLSALTLLCASLISLGSQNVQAKTSSPDLISGKQKVTFSAGGDCVDEYDDNQSDYEIFQGDDCYFIVTVSPASPQRKIGLQYQNGSRWITESESKTSKKGVAFLRPSTTSSDGNFLCDWFTYRLGVARLGAAKAVLSEPFNIEFVADDGFCS